MHQNNSLRQTLIHCLIASLLLAAGESAASQPISSVQLASTDAGSSIAAAAC
jgi:hypothetical protein